MFSEHSQAFLDEYVGYRLEATAAAFIAINTIFVGLRVLSQYVRPAGFGWDDIWTVFAWMVLTVECSLCIFVVENNAIGYHIVAQILYRPEKIAFWGKWNLYVIPSLYVIASTLPKFSILALYLRIFVGKWLGRTCWVTAAILAIAMVVNFFTVVFQCSPRAKAWDPTLPGTCNDIEAHFRYSALPNVFTDIIMLIIPIPMTVKLQCPKRTKIAIICTFLLGSLGLVTALFRMITFFTTTSIPIGDGATIADSTWDGNLETIWIVVEPSVYLISACLLSCRALVNWLLNDTAIGSKTSSLFRNVLSDTWTSRSNSKAPSVGLELHGEIVGVGFRHVRSRDQQSVEMLTTNASKGSDSVASSPRAERYLVHTKEGPKADYRERFDPYETV